MKRRHILQLAGAGALLPTLSGLSACGGKDKQGGSPADLGTVTMMLPLYGTQAPAADGALQKALEKFTGKTFKITWAPNSSYDDKVNVVLASDDVPELLATGKTPNFIRSAQAGAFWDLTDKLKDYPELQSENPKVQNNASINGKIYGVYKARDAMREAVSVRKDWLDKLGLSMPKSTQDLYDIAKAFTTEDPNGDGKKNTCGLVLCKWPGGYGSASPFDVMEVWYGAPNKWGERDGKLIPGFDTDEFFAANAFMRKLVSDGLVNKNFTTLDAAKWNDPFFNGQGGMIMDVSSRGLKLLSLFQEKYPKDYGKYVDMCGNLIGPDGTMHAYPTTGYNGFIAVSKQTVPTESELTDILKFLAKLNTKKGQVLLNNGIEGKNFKVVDGYAEAVNEKDPEAIAIGSDVKCFAQLGMAVSGYKAYHAKPSGKAEADLDAKRTAFHASDLKHAVYDPTQALVSKTYTEKGAQLDLIVGDARLKYVAGQLNLDGLKKELKRWHSSGGDQIIKEMNDLYAKMS